MTLYSFVAVLWPWALAIAVGLAGWRTAKFLRFPAPAMIGPMISTAVTILAGVPRAHFPPWLRVALQAVIGGNIGRALDREALRVVGTMLPGMAMAATWYVITTAALGFLLSAWTGISAGTAFLSTAPGGVAEMTALAVTTGEDVPFVATLQALRVVATNTLVPLLARHRPGTQAEFPATDKPPEAGSGRRDRLHWAAGLTASLAGGAAFTALGIPAGGVIGAMVITAVLRVSGVRFAASPRPVLTGAYLFLGISVGYSFEPSTLDRLYRSAPILLAMTAMTLACGLILGVFVQHIMHVDRRTAMLASSPGGLSLMAVVADETGGGAHIVSMFHLVRIIWVVLAMPVFLSLVH